MSLRGLSSAFTSFNTAHIKFILLFLFTAAWNVILSVAQSWQIVCQKSSLELLCLSSPFFHISQISRESQVNSHIHGNWSRHRKGPGRRAPERVSCKDTHCASLLLLLLLLLLLHGAACGPACLAISSPAEVDITHWGNIHKAIWG